MPGPLGSAGPEGVSENVACCKKNIKNSFCFKARGPIGGKGEQGDIGEPGRIGAPGKEGSFGPIGLQGEKGDRLVALKIILNSFLIIYEYYLEESEA
jgi:hypothetical protein